MSWFVMKQLGGHIWVKIMIFSKIIRSSNCSAKKISRSASQNDTQQLVSMAALAANDRTLYQMICGKDNISKMMS